MKQLLLIIFCFIIGFSDAASGQLYKYYDKNGNLSFTDDASMVPEDQRESAEAIQEIETKTLVPGMSGTKKDTPSMSDQAIKDNAKLKSEFEQEENELDGIKKALDEEYKALSGRREKLIQITEGEEKMNSKKIKVYNQKAYELNQDTLKFQEKQQAYFKRAKAYNLKLESAP